MICGNTLTHVVCNSIVYIIIIDLCSWYACVPPLMYIAMDCITRYVFSLRVFKQMDAHTGARIHKLFYTYKHAFIHSF